MQRCDPIRIGSLDKKEVFGLVIEIPEGAKPVRYKWVFVRKRNEKNEGPIWQMSFFGVCLKFYCNLL